MDYLEEKELLKKRFIELEGDIRKDECIKYFGVDPANKRKIDEYIEERFSRRYHNKYQTNYNF